MSDPEIEAELHPLRRGDRGARDRVLAWALPRIDAYLRLNTGRHLRARESHEDLVQTVCREVLADARDFRGSTEAQLQAWVLRLAERKLHARHRAQRAQCRDRRREVPLDVDRGSERQILTCYSSLATPSEALSVREQIDRVETAVSQLPEEQRRVLSMARILGMSYGEIAAELGKTEPAVRKVLSRARARLSLLLALDPEPS